MNVASSLRAFCLASGLALAACTPSQGKPDAGGAPVADSGVPMDDGGLGPLGNRTCPKGDGGSDGKWLGPDGGTVTYGPVTLTIPPGALSEGGPITISAPAECPLDELTSLTPLYRFEPDGLTFAKPVQITFAYDGGPAVLRWTAASDGWETPGISGGGAGGVTAQITHFSEGYLAWSETLAASGLQFMATPQLIDLGSSATLIVAVPGVDGESCRIDPDVGDLTPATAPSGGGFFATAVVSPTVTTKYTASCTGPVTAKADATIGVNMSHVFTFSILPPSIMRGQSATVMWNTTWPYCYFYSWDPTVPTGWVWPSDSFMASPQNDARYKLYCWDSSGAWRWQRRTLKVDCRFVGEGCGAPSQCCDWAPKWVTTCDVGKCCLLNGYGCDNDGQCCGSDVCKFDACCTPQLLHCTDNKQCCYGRCSSTGLCCTDFQQYCLTNDDCCSQHCGNNKCCAPDYAPCNVDADCCGEFSTCQLGSCKPCGMPGTSCVGVADCCTGFLCKPNPTANQCCISHGGGLATCTSPSDCCVTSGGYNTGCSNGVCCNTLNFPCDNNFDCCGNTITGQTGNLYCNNGVCCARTCASAFDCCAGQTCNNGLCG